jgi:hypothetical protein
MRAFASTAMLLPLLLVLAGGCRSDRSTTTASTAPTPLPPVGTLPPAGTSPSAVVPASAEMEGAAPANDPPPRDATIDPDKAWYESPVHGFTD